MSEDERVTAGNHSYFPPEDYLPPPWEPVQRPSLRETLGAPLLTFAATTVALVLTGAPLAFLWHAFAPTAVVLRTASGPQPAAPESSQVFATDGWFAVVSLFAGLVLGAVAWFLLRDRGPAGPIGLATGGTLAALVAAGVGRQIVVDRYLYDFCKDAGCLVYDGTLHLHALPVVTVFPVALLTSFIALTFFLEKET